MLYPGVKHFAWCKVASSVPLLIWSLLLLRTLNSIQVHKLFVCLAKGIGKKGKALHYKGSSFHRIMPSLMVSVNGKRRPRHQRFAVFHHNINNKLVSTESAAESLRVYTGWTACSVREWMCCTKMEADGNQSRTPKSKVVSFLCNSTRGAFSISSSIDHVRL
ncbi:hypothetical protein Bca52824_051548 [Brassica carinata]|uniref:Uncharacterized protein n=1 Tax=Brassica carinata TaxID=52824 RepID=A0A8X7R0E3_BRACI|nr:hypothetical protein Bca52824_051548 [Brassica carinata]